MTLEELFSIKIVKPDGEIRIKSKEKWDAVAKPIDGLGSFEAMISHMAEIQRKTCPDIEKKAIIIMCADNGVFEEGVSQTNQKVTRDVAELMGQKKSSVGTMAKDYPLDFFVYDVGINCEDTPAGVIAAKVRKGTSNFVKGPAMTLDECLLAITTGIEAVKNRSRDGYGIIATGEMGIGNTTTSTALLCALMGLNPAGVTGRGAGLSDSGLKKKAEVVQKGLELHRGEKKNSKIVTKKEAIDALMRLGGFDIAGLTGVFIGGALYHVPIVVDGLISAVAGLLAERLVPGSRDYMIPSHMGREKGMEIVLGELSLKPVIHADLALGEGTGAIMLFPMLDMAMSLYLSGTEFNDTVIEQYERFDR